MKIEIRIRESYLHFLFIRLNFLFKGFRNVFSGSRLLLEGGELHFKFLNHTEHKIYYPNGNSSFFTHITAYAEGTESSVTLRYNVTE